MTKILLRVTSAWMKSPFPGTQSHAAGRTVWSRGTAGNRGGLWHGESAAHLDGLSPQKGRDREVVAQPGRRKAGNEQLCLSRSKSFSTFSGACWAGSRSAEPACRHVDDVPPWFSQLAAGAARCHFGRLGAQPLSGWMTCNERRYGFGASVRWQQLLRAQWEVLCWLLSIFRKKQIWSASIALSGIPAPFTGWWNNWATRLQLLRTENMIS